MSFIYSRALVEASSAANCLDTELYAPSNGSHTHKPCFWHDKTMEPFRLSRFGMTCKLLTENLGAELLTSWQEGFRVKTSPWPEKVQEFTESAAECGNTWRGWLAKYDRATSSWRTAQCSLLEDLTECLETLPRSGMTQDGLLWGLQMLERRTSATDSGFLHRYLFPTPTCNPEAPNHGSNSKGPHNLKEVALNGWSPGQMWPTPTVSGNYNKKGLSLTSGDGLATAVMKRMWPTPTAHNAKETNAPSKSARNTPTLAAQAGGSLNPTWVEWLMGWPIGHTDLKQSETAKCRNAQQQPGDI